MKHKRFKSIWNDSYSGWWEIWNVEMTSMAAIFYGKSAQKYARNHVRYLNGLPYKYQP